MRKDYIRAPISLSSDGLGLIVTTGKTEYHVHSDEMTKEEHEVHRCLTEHGDCICLTCSRARVSNLVSQGFIK